MVMKRAIAGGLRAADLYDEGGQPPTCDEESLEICERGMRIHTRCDLKVSTAYDVALSYRDEAGRLRAFTVEATVVEKELRSEHCHFVTLYFSKVPEELLAAIRDGSLIEACFHGGTECREGRAASA